MAHRLSGLVDLKIQHRLSNMREGESRPHGEKLDDNISNYYYNKCNW